MSYASPDNGHKAESLADGIFDLVDGTIGIYQQQQIAVTPALIEEQLVACRFSMSLGRAEREIVLQHLLQKWIPASSQENRELEAVLLGAPTEPGLLLQALDGSWLPIAARNSSRIGIVAHAFTGRLQRVLRRQTFKDNDKVWPPPLPFMAHPYDPDHRSPARETVARIVAAFTEKQPKWRTGFENADVQNAFCNEAVEELLRTEVRRLLLDKLQLTFGERVSALQHALGAEHRIKQEVILRANNGERTEMISSAVRIGVEALTASTQQAVKDVVQGVLSSDRKAQQEGLFQCPREVIEQIVDALHSITDHAIRDTYDTTPQTRKKSGTRAKRTPKKSS